MSTQTRVAFITFVAGATLGLASLPVLVSAHDGGRDHRHEHDHDYPSEDELSDDPFSLGSVESGEVLAPSQPPSELDITPNHQPFIVSPKRLKNCTWRTEVADTNTGGVFAQCELNEVPVGTGVHRVLAFANPNHLINLGFADHVPESDGIVDEYLSDAHPSIHGEPPADNRLAADYVLMTHPRGTGKHNVFDGATENQTVVTLCCEVSP
jgi:hypothetical protein